MSGKIPYKGSTAVGAQVSPKRKGMIPTSTKIGYPSRNKKRRMNVTTTTAKKAAKKNTVLIVFSFSTEKCAMLSAEKEDIFFTIFTDFCLPKLNGKKILVFLVHCCYIRVTYPSSATIFWPSGPRMYLMKSPARPVG